MTTISTDVRRFCFDLDSQEGAPRTADDGRQLLPLRLAPASVNLWKPTWSCTNQKQQKRVCLILCTRQKKNNTSCELRRDFRVRTRWTSAQHVTPNWRLCSSPDSSRTIWDTFQEQLPQHKEMLEALFEIYKQQFKQVSDKSGQETRKTVKVVDISSNLLFLFCFTRRPYVFRLRVKWI